MKNLFVVLVLIASGYLLITQTKISEYVNDYMPNAQFEKLNESLESKLNALLENSVDDLVNSSVNSAINSAVEESLAEVASKLKADVLSSIELTTNNEKDEKIKVLSEKIADLTARVNRLTVFNQALKVPVITSLTTQPTVPDSNNENAKLVHKVQDDVSTNTKNDTTINHGAYVNINEQRKLTLQHIATQMNQQTLSLLVNE